MNKNRKKIICRILFMLNVLIGAIAMFIVDGLLTPILLIFVLTFSWMIGEYEGRNNV